MRHIVIGAEQPALFGREYDEQDGALGLYRIQPEGVRHFHHPHRARPVVIGAVHDSLRTDAIVIVVRAIDDGLGLKRRVTAFQQAGHVERVSTLPFAHHVVQLNSAVGYGERHRARFAVDAVLNIFSLLTGGREKVGPDLRRYGEKGNGRSALCQRFRRDARRRSRLRRPAHGRMVGIRHREHGGRTVPLRVQRLVVIVGVARVASAVEDRLLIVLLRLVVENQDHLALHVDTRVIVVAQFGRADAVAGEDHLRANRPLVRKVACHIGRPEGIYVDAVVHRERRLVAVHLEFNQGHGLQIRIAHQRLEPCFGELARDPLNGGLIAAFKRPPPLKRVGRQKRQVGLEPRALNGIEAFGNPRPVRLRAEQRRKWEQEQLCVLTSAHPYLQRSWL